MKTIDDLQAWLVEQGFVLEQYPDGKFWILRAHDDLFVQLSEDLADITLYENGWVENDLTHVELETAVNQLKCITKDDE